jgi:hypothetical protein
MKPPYFVWKSGTLDVCDTLDELDDRYPAGTLGQEGVVVCDSQGRPLWMSRAADGGWANAVEGPQPPSPELLRSVLWKYLRSRGTPPDEIESLSLNELVHLVCPPDPLPDKKIKEAILWKVCIFAFTLFCVGIAMLIEWWRKLP